MVKLALMALAVAATTLASAGSAGTAVRHCGWGASSVHAELVHGKIVTSAPVVTGCAP